MVSRCCWGITLKKGVRLVALFEMVLNTFTAISTVALLFSDKTFFRRTANPGKSVDSDGLSANSREQLPGSMRFVPGTEANGLDLDVEEDDQMNRVAMIFFLILLIGEIFLAWILYRGASKEKFPHLRTWWWIKLGMMILFLAFDILEVFTQENRILEFIVGAQLLYQGYVLWMVKALIDEIRGIGPPRFTQLTSPKVNDGNDQV